MNSSLPHLRTLIHTSLLLLALTAQSWAQDPAAPGAEIEVVHSAVILVSQASSVDFGSTPVTETSLVQTFTLKNIGVGDLENISLSFGGTHGGDFDVEGVFETTTVLPDEEVTFDIIFRPLGLGARSATLFIESDDADENPFEITLTGTGTLPTERIYAVTLDQRLISFNSTNPGTLLSNVPITGVNAGIVDAIDFDPLTQKLYGLVINEDVSNLAQLYEINRITGAATIFGAPFIVVLGEDASFSLDVNPKTEELHIVSTAGQNLRVSLTTGNLISTDSNLSYAAGDINEAATPQIMAIAFSNNVAMSAATTLYGWDYALDRLVTIGSPNGAPISGTTGQLFTIGGPVEFVSGTNTSGFDISGLSEVAYMTFDEVEVPGDRLWSVNLLTGEPTDLGLIGSGVEVLDSAVFIAAPQNSPEIVVEQPAGTSLVSDVDEVDFGNVGVGFTATRTFELRNVGDQDLEDIALSFAGLNAADYEVVGVFNTTTLAPDAQVSFTVRLTAAALGTREATLVIDSNDSDESPFNIALTGEGVNATPPVITQDPIGGSYPIYTPITLSVTATGTPVLRYQWLFEGSPILGADESTYEIPSFSRFDEGTYTVIVTNDFGSDTSEAAELILTGRTITRTGDPIDVPGFPGAQIGRPLVGAVSAFGQVVLQVQARVGPGGITAENDQMVLSNVSGTMTSIGQEGRFLGSGTQSRLFYHLNAPLAGPPLYRNVISNASAVEDTAYFISPDGTSLEILSREGDESPEGGISFSNHTSPAAVALEGTIYFDSQLTGPGVTSRNNSGVWFESFGDLGTIAREGEQAPTGEEVADQAWYGQILGGSASAGIDEVAFIAELQDDPLNPTNKTDKSRNIAVFSGSAYSDTFLLLRKGDAVTALDTRTGGDETVIVQGFNAVAASCGCDYAVVATLRQGGSVNSTNNQALVYVDPDYGSKVIAQKGQNLPETGVIKVIERIFAGINQEIIFEVTLEGSTTQDCALCRWTESEGIEVLVHEGDPAPGGGLYGQLRAVSVNPFGFVMYQDTRAIWRDIGAGMEMVIKTGDTYMDGPTLRPVLSLAASDETVNTRRAGGGFGNTISIDGSVLAIISSGSGVYVVRVIP